MATFTIVVKGIAIAYHKGDWIWRILFPFDNCHTVNFKLYENDPGIPLAGPNRQVSVEVINPVSEGTMAANVNSFIDITALYSCKDGVEVYPNWAENAVLMSIPYADLSVDEYSKSRYLVVENNPAHTVTKPASIIGCYGKFVIQSKQIIINVTDANGISIDGFPRAFDRDGTLVFDNHCIESLEEIPEDSDYQMIYSVIYDKADPAMRYDVVRDPKDMPKPPGVTLDRPGLVGDNPAPGEPGTPCYMIIASDPDNLPPDD